MGVKVFSTSQPGSKERKEGAKNIIFAYVFIYRKALQGPTPSDLTSFHETPAPS
jgi:hypothetical protein